MVTCGWPHTSDLPRNLAQISNQANSFYSFASHLSSISIQENAGETHTNYK